MSAHSRSWSVETRREQHQLAWTQRFVVGAALVLLYVLIQVDWLGLVPGTSTNLLAQATWVALAGWMAVRLGAVGLAIGFFIAVFGLFIDQLTIAFAVPPMATGLPDDYWMSNTLRVAASLALYPLAVRALATRLPPPLKFVAIPLVLLVLPFVRGFDFPEHVLRALSTGSAGLLVAVPWLQLVVVATGLAIGIEIVAARIGASHPLRTAIVFALVATLVVPGSQAAADSLARSTGVLVRPSEGGPLDTVRLETASGEPSVVLAVWDGVDALDPDGQPVRGFTREGIATAIVVPALQPELRPGAHTVGLRIGATTRTATYRVTPANSLRISLDERVIVVGGGRGGASVQLLVLGPNGAEQFTAQFDAKGGWRSDRPLPPGSFLVICQEGSTWAQLTTN